MLSTIKQERTLPAHWPSKLLYHYTSAHALMGIIDSDCLWASQCQYLNDSAEFQHSIDLLKTTITNYPLTHVQAVNTEIKAAVLEYMSRIDPVLFVACFSEEKDSLSQWRSYCPPSLGYNIGFDLDKLILLAKEQGFQMGACIYDPDLQMQFCYNWATQILVDFTQRFPPGGNATNFVQENINGYLNFFIEKCSFFKNKAFEEEREYRLISLMPPPMDRVKVRVGKSMLIPYLPFRLNLDTEDGPIYSLTVGPTPNMFRAERSINFLVRKIQSFSYWQSSIIPYRDW